MQISKLKNLIEQNSNGVGELVVVEGLHAVKHALRFKAQSDTLVCRDKAYLLKLAQKLCPDLVDRIENEIEEIGEDFDKLTSSKIRTGVLGTFKKPKVSTKGRSAVLLDDPRDLDNIGAVVRVVAAADIKTLIVSGESNPWNFRAIRAGAGLQFALSIIQNPAKLPNLPIICFDERGEELDKKLREDLPDEAIYVFGSERDGISQKLKDSSTKIVRLPMQQGVSSMNLATSVAAALYSLR